MKGEGKLRPMLTWRSAVMSDDGPESKMTRYVLLTLSMHMNELGESCFPSIKLLARETRMSPRAVGLHLEAAIAAGWITKQAHGLAGQRWRRLEYSPGYPWDRNEPVDNSGKGEYPRASAFRKVSTPTTKGEYPHATRIYKSTSRVLQYHAPVDKSARAVDNVDPAIGRAVTGAVGKKPKTGAGSIGSRLPEGYEVPDHWIIMAMGLQPTWSEDHCRVVAKMFCNHWLGKPGRLAFRTDWGKTWENWTIKEGPMRGSGYAPPRHQEPICVYQDKPGADICGAQPARASVHYGGLALCFHHERKIIDANPRTPETADAVHDLLNSMNRSHPNALAPPER